MLTQVPPKRHGAEPHGLPKNSGGVLPNILVLFVKASSSSLTGAKALNSSSSSIFSCTSHRRPVKLSGHKHLKSLSFVSQKPFMQGLGLQKFSDDEWPIFTEF